MARRGPMTEAELFRAYGVAGVADEARCPMCGDWMGSAVVDGYGVLLWWCGKCGRAVDDETLRRELASRRSCLRKMRSLRS